MKVIKVIHFRPHEGQKSEIQKLIEKHKFSISDAMRYLIYDWMKLRDEKEKQLQLSNEVSA